MGAYLSEPSTATTCEEQENDKLKYGASSMQGWRVSQEDAHSCILGYDDDTSLFAVFDGHGGAEVAQYTSKNLPAIIKANELYKKGNIHKALEESFLALDAELIGETAQEELKVLAGESPSSDEEAEDRREEEIEGLLDDAHKPLDEILQDYENRALEPKPINTLKNLPPAIKQEILCRVGGAMGLGKSPNLKPKRISLTDGGCSSSSLKDQPEALLPGCSSSSSSSTSKEGSSDAVANGETKAPVGELKKQHSLDMGDESDLVAGESAASSAKAEQVKDAQDTSEKKVELKSTSEENEAKVSASGDQTSSSAKPEEEKSESKPDEEKKEVTQAEDSSSKSEPSASSSTSGSNDEAESEKKVVKGKKKAEKKPFIYPPPKKTVKKSEEPNLYQAFMADMLEDEEMEDDDEDASFKGKKPYDESSEEESELEEEDEEDSEEMEEEEEMEDDEEEEDEIDDEEEDPYMMGNTPGYDSGCTAVVALLRGNTLYVANAGDSRCVVSRDGQAIEMSSDHKPEDAPEKERIEKAGGRITEDGRVNGGLNLSRAIGDHTYKQTPSLDLKDQMISSFPDIRTLHLEQDKDEFMVLACDGIWNSMTSQEVVDFVRPRIKEGKKLSKICDELFFHCLAPNTDGDGTGCDNMTCIIVKFDKLSAKRKCDESENEVNSVENLSDAKSVKKEDSSETKEQPKTNGASTNEHGQGDEVKVASEVKDNQIKSEAGYDADMQEKKKLKTESLSSDSPSVTSAVPLTVEAGDAAPAI